MIRRTIKTLIVALLFGIVLGSLVVYMRYKRPCATRDLNVLLIVLDTVRADYLSCYGNKKVSTPFIDSVAKNGILFSNAYSTAPWTLPSHASLFTGKYPYSHGATQEHLYLENKHVTLAELLKKRNYQSASFSANGFIGPGTNLTQGFDVSRFCPPALNTRVVGKIKVLPEFLNKTLKWAQGTVVGHSVNLSVKKWWIEKYTPYKPFFIFLNYVDAHAPYTPPRRYLTEDQEKMAAKLPQWWPGYFLGDIKYSEKDFELLKTLYAAEIKYIDACVKDIVAFLEERGAMDNTLLILTSDHGENIGEHGLMDHVFCLYNTTLHIPLIIKHKTLFSGNRICSIPVQLNDIFTTIVEACNINSVNKPNNAYSLIPESWEKIPDDRIVFSEYFYPKQALSFFDFAKLKTAQVEKIEKHMRGLKSLKIGKYKIIVPSNGHNEMYDIDADPDEKKDILKDHEGTFKSFNAKLDDFMLQLEKADDLVSKPEFNKQTMEQLRALGYLR